MVEDEGDFGQFYLLRKERKRKVAMKGILGNFIR